MYRLSVFACCQGAFCFFFCRCSRVKSSDKHLQSTPAPKHAFVDRHLVVELLPSASRFIHGSRAACLRIHCRRSPLSIKPCSARLAPAHIWHGSKRHVHRAVPPDRQSPGLLAMLLSDRGKLRMCQALSFPSVFLLL